MSRAAQIADILASQRFLFRGEAQLQDHIDLLLRHAGYDYQREVRLSEQDRVDFLVEGVALEVKASRTISPVDVLRQLQRYAAHYQVRELLLVTTRAAHCAKLPALIGGKPCAFHFIRGGVA